MSDDAPTTTPPADATIPDAPTVAAASSATGAPATNAPATGAAAAAADDDDEWEYVDEDEDDEDVSAQAPAAPRARSRVAELLALSAFCVMLGGMFAGAVLGVMYAPARRVAPHAAAALAASRADASPEGGAALALAADAACDADEAGAAQEADPEVAGDGVMDDLDDGPAEPVPAATPTTPAPAPPRPVLARTAVPSAAPAPAPAPAPPRGRRVVTSDDVPEGPAQGYVHGRAVRITVTRLDGKPVEVHTAAAYRRMREAAQRDGVALRIASGFRTMEHQQALYRAYRQGRGNLAAVPGHSNHQSGHALDLNTSTPGVFRWLTRNGRRFGFRRTVPTEPWHWEWW